MFPTDERTNWSLNSVPSVIDVFAARGTHRADLIACTLQQQLKQRRPNSTALNARQYISLGEDETPKKGSIFQIILRLIRHDKRRLSFVRLSF